VYSCFRFFGEGEGRAQRRFKLGRKRIALSALGTRRRQRRRAQARGKWLGADRGGERVPIGGAKRLGDQFETLADGDLETFGGKGRTQCMRHGFGVAEVAHVSILCLDNRDARRLRYCPLVRAKGLRSRSYLPLENLA
jgi:hypothetical protein